MAEPTDTYPEAATKGGRPPENGDGEQRLREVIDAHGEDLAAAIDRTDEAADLVETAVVVLASADEGEIDDLAASASNLAAAADGLSTDEAADLAADVGENGDDLAAALDALLALQREDHLEDLVDLARTLSALDVDEDTAAGLNTVLGAVGEAEREAEPVGPLGFLAGLRSRDARAGLGYLLALLRAQGRRLRE